MASGWAAAGGWAVGAARGERLGRGEWGVAFGEWLGLGSGEWLAVANARLPLNNVPGNAKYRAAVLQARARARAA